MHPSINPVTERRSGLPSEPVRGETAADQRLARTLEVWSPRSARPLTDEDARQIAENMTGFFQVLLEWKARKRAITARRDRAA